MPDLSDWNEDGSKSESLLGKEIDKGNRVTVDWQEVVKEERNFLDFMEEKRVKDGTTVSDKFALAFSGGGLRAAAFQSGVLWQLAKRDRLKDVTYFIAVSGGGYVASSFASHCAGKPPPESGGVKAWYLQVVADTICRMQENAGNFVRDAVAKPLRSDKTASPDDGCMPWPRFLDLPLLLGALFLTLALHPTMYVTFILVPMTIILDVFFGPGMRAAFCYAGPNSIQEVPNILWQLTPIKYLIKAVASSLGASLVFSLMQCIKCCKAPGKKNPRTLKRPPATLGYRVGHAATSFLVRISVIMILITAIVGLCVGAQILSYPDPQERENHCASYISAELAAPPDNNSCVDYFRDGVVLDESELRLGQASNTSFRDMSRQAFWTVESETPAAQTVAVPQEQVDHSGWSIFGIIGVGLLAVSALLCIFLPCLGATNIVTLAAWVGPVLVLASTVSVIQYAVFGPVTGNVHGIFGIFNPQQWHNMVSWCLILNLPILVAYEELRSTLHFYYKHCLQKNFFSRGSDLRMAELAKDFFHANKSVVPIYKQYKYDVNANKLSGASYCPLLMVTATSSDYQPPGDEDTISEVSITPLHTGGEETHYVRTPRSRSLAKCTALTGAGCLDAISLSMQHSLYLRFWLEALNLSWGDYLLHNTKKSYVASVAERTFDKTHAGWQYEDIVIRLVHRAVGGFLWLVAFILVLLGWWDMQKKQGHLLGHFNTNHCEEAALFFKWALYVVVFMVATAFLSFVPVLDLFSLSSISRLLLQLTKYMNVGELPPRLLYCTDGGVQDCTGLVQLMRRQCPRIFLVLAGADPLDELLILKMGIDCAEKERIGSFYDPANPKRDFKLLLEEYQAELMDSNGDIDHSKSGSVLHIKICYGYRDVLGKPLGKKEPKYGDLYIVKNRLPVEGVSKIQPLITADEVNTGNVTNVVPSWGTHMTNKDLGPFGCCDCCHGCCNMGKKFPHGTFTGYLYMSPMWFSSLSRLGFSLSSLGMDKMDSHTA